MSIPEIFRRVRLTVAVALTAVAVPAVAAEVADTLLSPAMIVAHPAQAVLLGVARAGSRLVAVGEHGLVLLSDDDGRGWRQAPTPVGVTLTAVTFPSSRTGWAVGHRGVILHSADGGESWSRQLDGAQFAAQAQRQAALNMAAGASSPGRALADADLLVRDGADKAFLAVDFTDDRHGLAVGAYGLCARTGDGGEHWVSCMTQLPNPKAAHLYAIARSGSVTWIAGEQGLLLRSAGDEPFLPVPVSYGGTFFCLGIAGNGDVLLGGLRGNAFASTDGGSVFKRLDVGRVGSCAAMRSADGRLLAADDLGQISRYDPALHALSVLPGPPQAPLSDFISLPRGELLTVGVRGVSVRPGRSAPL